MMGFIGGGGRGRSFFRGKRECRPGKRSATRHFRKDLNLDLRSQLNHAVRWDLKLVRRAQGVTLQNKV